MADSKRARIDKLLSGINSGRTKGAKRKAAFEEVRRLRQKGTTIMAKKIRALAKKSPTGETSKKNVRAREKILGTPKEKRQANTRINKRAAGERGAKKRVQAMGNKRARLAKAISQLKANKAAGKVGKKDFKNAVKVARQIGKTVSNRAMAKAARLSKTAASGAG